MTEPTGGVEPEQWICGQRETRTVGVYECVNPPTCDGGHYYVRLNVGERGGS